MNVDTPVLFFGRVVMSHQLRSAGEVVKGITKTGSKLGENLGCVEKDGVAYTVGTVLAEAAESGHIRVEIGDGLTGYSGVHGGLCDGGWNNFQQTGIHRLREDVIASKREVFLGVGFAD